MGHEDSLKYIRSVFRTAQVVAATLKDSPAVVLNYEDYFDPTVEVGCFTIHIEIREVNSLTKRKALCAVVGENIQVSCYPNAPDDFDWRELSYHESLQAGAVNAVLGLASYRMHEACMYAPIELEVEEEF